MVREQPVVVQTNKQTNEKKNKPEDYWKGFFFLIILYLS